jgi:hypothetical protein
MRGERLDIVLFVRRMQCKPSLYVGENRGWM